MSFYNDEAEALLREYDGELWGISRNTVAHVFAETADITGIDISAQTLRSVFAKEMGLRGCRTGTLMHSEECQGVCWYGIIATLALKF